MNTANNILNEIISKVRELDDLLAQYGLQRNDSVRITSSSLRERLDIDIQISELAKDSVDEEDEE